MVVTVDLQIELRRVAKLLTETLQRSNVGTFERANVFAARQVQPNQGRIQ